MYSKEMLIQIIGADAKPRLLKVGRERMEKRSSQGWQIGHSKSSNGHNYHCINSYN
jgi:hypothetical protein